MIEAEARARGRDAKSLDEHTEMLRQKVPEQLDLTGMPRITQTCAVVTRSVQDQQLNARLLANRIALLKQEEDKAWLKKSHWDSYAGALSFKNL